MMPERRTHDRPIWIAAYEYPDMESADVVYLAARDIVFGNDVDASVYRIQLNGVPHVVLVGEQDLDNRLQDQIAAVWGSGRVTEIPDEVADILRDRRQELKLPGLYWERRSPSPSTES